jgi:hypothetical protein
MKKKKSRAVFFFNWIKSKIKKEKMLKKWKIGIWKKVAEKCARELKWKKKNFELPMLFSFAPGVTSWARSSA